MTGYDIIGDIHGCGTLLVRLLESLGYRVDASGAYAHSERQAIFVGDLVDRGEEHVEVLKTVKRMVDSGSAQIVMGNHEFNAIAYDTERPDRQGEYLRPRNERNNKQHKAFLAQVDGDSRVEYLEWFRTMPLWLDLDGIRVVHACWHEPSMHVLREALGCDRFSSVEQFVRASDKSDPLYEAVEILLKGPEIDLSRHGLPPYFDKDGTPRRRARVAWWRSNATTLRDLAVMDGPFKTADGRPYPELPGVKVDGAERSFAYTGDVPVFYGHYWRSGEPERGVDYTARTACVDFSAIKTGKLVAYRWDGETEIQPDRYVSACSKSAMWAPHP